MSDREEAATGVAANVVADQMGDATRRLRDQAWMITIPTEPVLEPDQQAQRAS